MKKIWVIVIAVVCAGVFFYLGMVYGKSSSSAASAGSGRGTLAFSSSTRGTFGRTGIGAAGGGITAGQVIAVSPTSVTVQLANGNSQVVFFSNSTMISKQTTGSASDLQNGTQVTIVGTSNSDGSLTAQTIAIRPAGSTGFGGGFGAGVGNASSGVQSASQ